MRKITLLLIAVLIAGIILTSAVYAQIMRKPADWSFHRKLNDDGCALCPAIAVEENNIHVLYVDTSSNAETFGGTYYREVCYRGSSDNGSTWNSAVGVSGVRLINFRSNPVLAVSNKSIHTVWMERGIGTGGNYIIRYRNSFDNGRNWYNDAVLRNTDDIRRLQIAANEDVIGVTWVEYPFQSRQLYYRISRDEGRTWVTEGSLPSLAEHSAFSINGNCIYLAYTSIQSPDERQVTLHKSIDAGRNWNDTLIPIDHADWVAPVGMVVNRSDVHLLLSCGYLKSVDGGENWSALNESITGSRIILSGNNLYVFRFDWRSDSMNYTKSNDNGLSWSSYTTMFNRTYYYDFDFALSENDVHLIFHETKSDSFDYFDYEIYSTKSTDEGKTWTEKIQITDHNNEYRQYILGIGIFAIAAPSIILLYLGYKWRKIERKKRRQRYLEAKKEFEDRGQRYLKKKKRKEWEERHKSYFKKK